MPEFVACPVCGCKARVAEGLLGQNVRCFGCGHCFVAVAEPSPPPVPRPAPGPRAGAGRRTDDEGEHDARGEWPQPFCPGCGRRIRWDVPRCPYCREELEPETDLACRLAGRGDVVACEQEPHRGAVIAVLGQVSAAAGALALCLFGLGAVVSVPLGVAAWVMANHDLERMRAGLMDAEGKSRTEHGRTAAIFGVVLGLLFAGFFVVVYITQQDTF